jgi:pimeloyl-ACP methyl ester carboxylesterase
MAGDLIDLAQQINLAGAVGIGHSMGGHLLVRMAAAMPQAFARLLLIEPVIFPPFVYGHAPTEHFASRRRNHFPSPQAMLERYQERPPFATWDRAVLADYVTHGLRPDPAGDGYILACPPPVEAAIYLTGMARENDPYPLLPRIPIPVHVMRASYAIRADGGFDMQASPTAADLAERFPNGTDQHLPQYSHFLPMEDPGLVAQTIESLNDDKPRNPAQTA